MAEQQQVQIALDPNLYAVTLAQVNYDEENFSLMFVSGGQGRQFHLTPKHAKRLLLLLQQQIVGYEKKFGELKTELPKVAGNTAQEREIGFVPPKK